ncbi:glycosyltransferase [Demequina subtropica]|uniref:glycosyltransferase n=1 Tax=Demequina subtropica TaxID=1638989 RepID=UPI000785A48E|nr:glycosyltransferase [Demequina subtropica]
MISDITPLSSASEPAPRAARLSVVVPIYGVERWLPEFLDSLVAQSFEDWDAVLVIDGSPDGCEAIAREHAARDPRIVVHVFDNGGLGRARNRGLRLATGEYVIFPDSDDVLAPDCFALLMAAADESAADIVTAPATDFFEDGRERRYWAHTTTLFDEPRLGVTLASEPRLILDHTAWNKVFRRALLVDNGLDYPVDTLCEDVAHTTRAYALARSVDVVPAPIYHHRRRSGAITEQVISGRIMGDWLTQTEDTLGFVRSIGDPEVLTTYLGRLFNVELWTRLQRFTEFDDAAERARFEALLDDAVTQIVDLQVPVQSGKLTAARRLLDGTLPAAWDSLGLDSCPLAPDLATASAIADAARGVLALDRQDPELRRMGAGIINSRVLNSASLAPDELGEAARDALAALADGGWGPRDLNSYGAWHWRGWTDDAADLRAFVAAARAAGDRAQAVRVSGMGLELALAGTSTLDLGVALAVGASIHVAHRPADGPEVRSPAAAWQVDGEWRWRARLSARPGTAVSGIKLRIEHPELGGFNVPVAGVEPASEVTVQAFEMRATLRLEGGDTLGIVPVESESVPRSIEHAPAPRVLVFPYWRSNPFLNIVYLDATLGGADIQSALTMGDLVRRVPQLTSGDVLHLHWPRPIVDAAESEEEAWANIDTVATLLDEARARGVRVLWTVHNALSHDTNYFDAEVAVHRMLADKADAVHIMSPHTAEVVGEFYAIDPAKTTRIAHPSYEGLYAPRLDRAQARTMLGAPATGLTVLHAGHLRPYKGLWTLAEAVGAVQAGRGCTLLLGGGVNEEYLDELGRLVDSVPGTVAQLERISDEDLGTWYSAADVAVLPYEAVLNSGSLHLAATYRVPVVLPDIPHLVDEFGDQAWVRFFDRAEGAASLARVLGDLDRDAITDADFDAFLEDHRPLTVSGRFTALLGLERGLPDPIEDAAR